MSELFASDLTPAPGEAVVGHVEEVRVLRGFAQV